MYWTDGPQAGRRRYPPRVKNERPHILNARVRYWSPRLMADRGMTITELARLTGFSRTTVHRVIYGKDEDEVYVGTVEAVAMALEVEPEALFAPIPGEGG